MDAENEIEAQTWHPNSVRMRMVGLPEAKLEQMTRDDNARQVERDVAAAILADRKTYAASIAAPGGLVGDLGAFHQVAEAEAEAKRLAHLEQQAAERAAAHANQDRTQPVDIEVTRTENEQAARSFAEMLQATVDPNLVHVMRTQAIAGSKVRDGWTVNYHDSETEVGLVAVWWGRGHFKAYIEMVGHIGRTAEAAALLGKVFSK